MKAEQPELVVFDLDFTLWDCGGTWCDCLSPPFSVTNSRVVDSSNSHIRLYPDILRIFAECDNASIPMALASRTEQPDWARELIALLNIDHRFAFAEIYPTTKLKHFAALHRLSGVACHQMLFFDDEMRNIKDVSTLGVTCVHVENGVDMSVFRQSLTRFQST